MLDRRQHEIIVLVLRALLYQQLDCWETAAASSDGVPSLATYRLSLPACWTSSLQDRILQSRTILFV